MWSESLDEPGNVDFCSIYVEVVFRKVSRLIVGTSDKPFLLSCCMTFYDLHRSMSTYKSCGHAAL